MVFGTQSAEQHYRYWFPKHEEGRAIPGLENVHNCATAFSICGVPLPVMSQPANFPVYGQRGVKEHRPALSIPEAGQMKPVMEVMRQYGQEIDTRDLLGKDEQKTWRSLNRQK